MLIYVIFALSFFNGTATQAARLVLPLYALHLGASPLVIGLLGAAFSILSLFLSMSVGRIADRFGSRWLLIAGAIGSGLSLLLPYWSAGLFAIFFAITVIGFGFGIYNVSLQNLVGVLSSADARIRNFSNFSMSNSAANFAAPLIAGFSVDHLGFGVSCLWLAFLMMLPVLLLMVWGKALPKGIREEASVKSGIQTLLAEPGIKRSLTISSLLLTGQDLFRTYMPVYGNTIGLSASTIGIVLSAFSAAAFVIRIIMQPLVKRFREQRLLAASFYVAAVCLVLIPLFKSVAILTLISFVFGLGMGCGQPIITMLMFTNSPQGRSGEVLGLRMTVVHLTRLIGPVTFGAIGTALGLLSMFWVNGLMMGGAGWLSEPQKKKQTPQ